MNYQMLDMSHLSPEECRKILNVIKRDEELRRNEEQRIFHLKAEIQRLRKRGVIREGSVDPSRSCARCLSPLGRLINRGALCPNCRKKVCSNCRIYRNTNNGQEWVCLICNKITQLKAISGEWMRDYSCRSGSDSVRIPKISGSSSSSASPSASASSVSKIMSSGKSSASDAISKSIRNAFRTGFLSQQHHSSSSQSIEDDHSVVTVAPVASDTDARCSPPMRALSFTRGIIPSRLPPIDPSAIKSSRSPPRSPKSPLSDGKSSRSSTEMEDSPKLPPSPVMKVLQSAYDTVSTAANDVIRNSPPTGVQQCSNLTPPAVVQQSVEKQTVFRKVSNRMLDSSSSEDEEEVEDNEKFKDHPLICKSNSTGSTPSPRTPNSCRILSSIAHNQATAFKFPPVSPNSSRPSSYERQSGERQSSDDFSAPLSPFRSRSTSSEMFDDSTDPSVTPQPMPRGRRVSPLRKQRAIAEELIHDSQRSSLEAEYGSSPSSATPFSSAPDSGVADCNYSSPPRKFFNSSGSGGSMMRRNSSGHEDSFGQESLLPQNRDSLSSMSESEAVIERSTGYVFRKVTLRKKIGSESSGSLTQSQHDSTGSSTPLASPSLTNPQHPQGTATTEVSHLLHSGRTLILNDNTNNSEINILNISTNYLHDDDKHNNFNYDANNYNTNNIYVIDNDTNSLFSKSINNISSFDDSDCTISNQLSIPSPVFPRNFMHDNDSKDTDCGGGIISNKLPNASSSTCLFTINNNSVTNKSCDELLSHNTCLYLSSQETNIFHSGRVCDNFQTEGSNNTDDGDDKEKKIVTNDREKDECSLKKQHHHPSLSSAVISKKRIRKLSDRAKKFRDRFTLRNKFHELSSKLSGAKIKKKHIKEEDNEAVSDPNRQVLQCQPFHGKEDSRCDDQSEIYYSCREKWDNTDVTNAKRIAIRISEDKNISGIYYCTSNDTPELSLSKEDGALQCPNGVLFQNKLYCNKSNSADLISCPDTENPQLESDTDWIRPVCDTRIWMPSVATDQSFSSYAFLAATETTDDISYHTDKWMIPEGDDYRLVFIENISESEKSCVDIDERLSSSTPSDGDDKWSNNCHGRGVLKVRSHIEISNGTVYIEDSDWEMCSDTDGDGDAENKLNDEEIDDNKNRFEINENIIIIENAKEEESDDTQLEEKNDTNQIENTFNDVEKSIENAIEVNVKVIENAIETETENLNCYNQDDDGDDGNGDGDGDGSSSSSSRNSPTVAFEEPTESVSNLEKYFTRDLEEDICGANQRRITPPHVLMSSGGCGDYDEEVSASGADHSADHSADHNNIEMNEISEYTDIDQHETDESLDADSCDNEIEVDATSTSSEEGLFTTPNTNYIPQCQPVYGNPLAYSLHTIVEESCEEYTTDRDSTRPSSPAEDQSEGDENDGTRDESTGGGSELENYFSFAISRCQTNVQYKRDSWSDVSDNASETSNAENDDHEEDLNAVKMASSRLEKYFTSGLLGSGAFNYPDDVEFADESDCDSFRNSLENQQNSNEQQFADESYDTVKRRGKKDTADETLVNISDAITNKNEDIKIVQGFDEEIFKENNKMETNALPHYVEEEVNENIESQLIAAQTAEIIDASNRETPIIVIENNDSEKSDKIKIDDYNVNNDNNNEICTNDCSKLLNDSDNHHIDNKKKIIEDDVEAFMTKLLSRMSNFAQIDAPITTPITNPITTANATIDNKNQLKGNDSRTEGSNESNCNNTIGNPLPSLKALESQIARLMQAVSPVTLSAHSETSDEASSTYTSSTIGSNNSDYGSDTLESGEYSDTDGEADDGTKENRRNHNNRTNSGKSLKRRESTKSLTNSRGSADSTVSEETVYICKQLMASLKKLTEIAFNDANAAKGANDTEGISSSDVAKARMYIRDQIVALMHSVQSSSRNGSPLREKKSNKIYNNNSPNQHPDTGDSSDCGDSSPKIGGTPKKKTPSESGSETTCSASMSIPSYDDSDHTPTESEISHEMEELFSLLECSNKGDNGSHGEGSNCLSSIANRPSSDDDRASLKSWEARISLFAKVQAAEETEGVPSVAIVPIEKFPEPEVQEISQPMLSPKDNNKPQEITINGQEIRHGNDASYPSNLPPLSGHKTVVKIDDNPCASGSARTDSLSPLFDSLKDRSFSSDSVSSVQTVKARFAAASASMSEISSDGTQSTSRLAIDEDDEQEVDSSLMSTTALRKSFNAKEKASSENNLLVANLMQSPAKTKTTATTKSAGNISELDTCANKSAFRDTGYYSFKSSEESIKSLEDTSNIRSSSTLTLPHQAKQPASETIEEVDEEAANDSAKMPATKRLFTPSHHYYHHHHHNINSAAAKTLHSFSSSNIPDEIFTGSRACSLPRSSKVMILPPPSVPHRSRSSFFSTSGVLRKLAALRGDENSFRASPRRLRGRNRPPSGGGDKDGSKGKTGAGGGVPQISVSDYSEQSLSSNRGSVASSGESLERHDDDVEHAFVYHSRSQTSLSSFGARSESMSSVYSAAGGGRYGSVAVTGEVLFNISYNYKAGAMEVYIKECRNLAPVKHNRSDPYVKVYLLPDRTKSGKRKTKVKKHTLNPVFDEVLKFYMTISEIETRTLWLSVWHSDIFGRNDFLGEVTLPLGHEVFESPGLRWYPLQERIDVSENGLTYKGDIFLALKYMPPDVTARRAKKSASPTKGELHVLVKEAHNLMATRSNGTSDPFCKSYLLPDRSKSGKQKTSVIKKTCNPKWNHTFVYEDITINDLRERCLELTIWDYDKITSNDFLGGVRLSLGIGKYQSRDVDWMDSIGDEIMLWQQMLDRPNMWVYGELHLRTSMQTRRS